MRKGIFAGLLLCFVTMLGFAQQDTYKLVYPKILLQADNFQIKTTGSTTAGYLKNDATGKVSFGAINFNDVTNLQAKIDSIYTHFLTTNNTYLGNQNYYGAIGMHGDGFNMYSVNGVNKIHIFWDVANGYGGRAPWVAYNAYTDAVQLLTTADIPTIGNNFIPKSTFPTAPYGSFYLNGTGSFTNGLGLSDPYYASGTLQPYFLTMLDSKKVAQYDASGFAFRDTSSYDRFALYTSDDTTRVTGKRIAFSDTTNVHFNALASYGKLITYYRNLVVLGTSLGYTKGYGGNTSFTNSYAYKTARALGFNMMNKSYVGRITQTLDTASIPLYTPGSFLILEGTINDATLDTTIYTPALMHTVINTMITNADGKGWPRNHIVGYIASFWSKATNANHGNIPYRHSIYAAEWAAIVSDKGILFWDNYTKFRDDNIALAGVLLDADELHATPRGQDSIAANLIGNLKPLTEVNPLTTIFNRTAGSAHITGDIGVDGNSNLKNLFVTNDIELTGLRSQIFVKNGTNAATIVPGGNFNTTGVTVNTRQLGGVSGRTYATNVYFPMVYYDATSTDNLVYIGGGLSAGVGGVSATGLRIFTATTPTGGGSQKFGMFGDGHIQIGGTTYTNDGPFLKLLGAATDGSTSGFRSAITMTPTAGASSFYLHDFDGLSNAGTGALTFTLPTATTSAADGVYTAKPTTNISGSGAGLTINFTVAAGVVSAVSPAVGGTGYANLNQFSSPDAPGAIFQVASIGYSGNAISQARFTRYPIWLSPISTPTTTVNGQIWEETTGLKSRSNNVTYSLGSSTILGTVSTGIWNATAITPQYLSFAPGTASLTTNGSTTSFNVTYANPGYTPTAVLWTPTSAIGATTYSITSVTSTGFTITYTTAPATGTATAKYVLIK